MKMYLAHPFDTRHKLRQWELEMEKKYPGFELINPFYDVERDEVVGIDEGRLERYQFDPLTIVQRDIGLIEKVCNYNLLAYVTNAFSIGTIIEMTISRLNQRNPRTLTLCVCDNGHHEHPWLRQFTTGIFKSHQEFEDTFLKTGLYLEMEHGKGRDNSVEPGKSKQTGVDAG